MQKLRQKDIQILSFLNTKEPEGAFLKEVAECLTTTEKKCSAQNAYEYLQKLKRKELVRHDTTSLYHITETGIASLNGFTSTIHIQTQTKPKDFKQEPQKEGSFTQPNYTGQATNLHAFEVHYMIYPTSYTQLEALFSNNGIAFKPSGNKKHPSYIIKWQGLRMRLGSRQIIVWGPELTEPIIVKHEIMEGKALKLNIGALTSLLQKTGIRVQETLNHQLKANVYYRELAIVNNAAIEKLHKNKGYTPIAYDRATGRASIWLDPTPTTAIETNKGKNHEVLRKWGQGIEDGEIKPYENEMQTRKEIADIKDVVYDLAKETSYLAKNNISHIPYFEQAIKKDAILIELAEALLPIAYATRLKKKLDDIKQRRLQ